MTGPMTVPRVSVVVPCHGSRHSGLQPDDTEFCLRGTVRSFLTRRIHEGEEAV